MIKALKIFIIFLLAVALGNLLQQDSGYVLIEWRHWSIQSTLATALIGFLALAWLMHLLIDLTHALKHKPRLWMESFKIHHAEKRTRLGLIAFGEGRWKAAKKNLIKGLPHANMPLINYLTAATAAEELGEIELRDSFFRDAEIAIPEASLAIALLKTRLQIDNQDYLQATLTLNKLQTQYPKHPYLLQLCVRLYQQTANWEKLLSLLPLLKTNLTRPKWLELRQSTYLSYLKSLITSTEDATFKPIMFNMPTDLAQDPEMLALYCEYLIKTQQTHLAEQLLRKSLNKNSAKNLIVLYSKLPLEALNINFVESLLKKNHDSAELHLCLGQISMHQKLFGSAKMYFEESLHLQPCRQTYLELGKLYEQLDDQVAATDAYRHALIFE